MLRCLDITLLCSVAQVDTVQAEESSFAAQAVEQRVGSDSGARSNGSGAVHAVTAPPAETAFLRRDSSTQRGFRPYIPQVDIPQLLVTLLGDPEKTLKDNTVLGSALVADGEFGPVGNDTSSWISWAALLRVF